MLEQEKSVRGCEELLWTDHPPLFPPLLPGEGGGWSEVELGREKVVA